MIAAIPAHTQAIPLFDVEPMFDMALTFAAGRTGIRLGLVAAAANLTRRNLNQVYRIAVGATALARSAPAVPEPRFCHPALA